MTLTLTEKQQIFVDTYCERHALDKEIAVNHALSMLAESEANKLRENDEVTIHYIDEIIDTWCSKHGFLRHESTVTKASKEHWLLDDEFGCKDYVTDVFPEHWISFQQFMKAYGFSIDMQSHRTISIYLWDW